MKKGRGAQWRKPTMRDETSFTKQEWKCGKDISGNNQSKNRRIRQIDGHIRNVHIGYLPFCRIPISPNYHFADAMSFKTTML